MSKVDAQRALREANYAARHSAGGPSPGEAAAVGEALTAPPARAADTKPARVARAAATVAEPQSQRCGHKSMSGRTCTRAVGHPEKSHRYS
jgi:hypothetical protein